SSFPPHVMFYAPNLTNDDIGADGSPGMPFVAYQGPQGYMIMVPADPAHDHAAAGAPVAANPVVDAARSVFPEHRKNIVASFTSMPAEKYSFKPTPQNMSFGELAIHIASANVYAAAIRAPRLDSTAVVTRRSVGTARFLADGASPANARD